MTTKIAEIPEEFHVKPFVCDRYLVDGELMTWKGNTTEVFSTIHSLNKNGEMGPTLLGSIPDMESLDALDALKAAEKAFQRGQGLWPTMRVGERLKCMETFVKKMKLHREEVVKLLMWEICKINQIPTKNLIVL